jgi:predicted metal-dependent phosphoesterase TrpH
VLNLEAAVVDFDSGKIARAWMQTRGLFGGALLLGLAIATPGVSQSSSSEQPAQILRGSLSGKDHQTYRLVPFQVPAGTKRITVAFDYTGRDHKTVIDIGLYDPERCRGWSGGNKSEFTLSEYDATSSYLPGPLPPGEWRLLLGIPNIRSNETSEYTAKIYLSGSTQTKAVVLKSVAGWYQGDLHTHTGHSDGTCRSLAGKPVPCPEFKVLEAAAGAKLDFVAVSDHNATSHYDDLLQWQPYFDTLLLVRGRELTTFFGHANMYGSSDYVDFRVQSGRTEDTMITDAHAAGALVSINHPGDPSGEVCMGCGWTAKGTDFSKIDAIEVINGPDAESPISGIPFWQERLNAGFRITAIGGSDDHASGTRLGKSMVGTPATVIYATQLSEPALLEGIRAGHVFIKVDGTTGPNVTFTATVEEKTANIGDRITARKGQSVELRAESDAAEDAQIELLRDGKVIETADAGELSFRDTCDGGRHWYRLNVRDGAGKLLALTNPVYVNFD